MSPPSSYPAKPSLQFRHLFDAALEEYSRKTGKDIATDPLAAKFLDRDCDSSDAVLKILEEQADAFNQFRNKDKDWKVELMRRLKPTVEILFSTSGVFGEDIGLVRLPRIILWGSS
jgi:hypothetical protein